MPSCSARDSVVTLMLMRASSHMTRSDPLRPTRSTGRCSTGRAPVRCSANPTASRRLRARPAGPRAVLPSCVPCLSPFNASPWR
jgi:hypothetical protein